MKINYKFIIFFIFLVISIQAKPEYGKASYYNDKYHGKNTANGEKYDKNKLTAAHKTLPFNTHLKVANLENNKVVNVRVNDRGPFTKGRIIDLSRRGATELGYVKKGLTKVKIEVINNPSSKKKDKRTELQSITYKFEELDKKYKKLKKENDILKKKYSKTASKTKNIQVGIFKNYINAARKKKEIEKKIKKKYIVSIIKEKQNNNFLHKVQILNIKNKDLKKFIKENRLTNIYVK